MANIHPRVGGAVVAADVPHAYPHAVRRLASIGVRDGDAIVGCVSGAHGDGCARHAVAPHEGVRRSASGSRGSHRCTRCGLISGVNRHIVSGSYCGRHTDVPAIAVNTNVARAGVVVIAVARGVYTH